MACETQKDKIMSSFGNGKEKIYTYGFHISGIHYTSCRSITSSPDFPDGFKVRCKGYIKGEIQTKFEMIFIFKDGTIIFTTETSIYCCENVGSFVKYVDENLKIIKQSYQDSKIGLFLEMTKSLRSHKSFSGKTRIFGNDTVYSMVTEDKQAYQIKRDEFTVIFTKAGSIHVHLI